MLSQSNEAKLGRTKEDLNVQLKELEAIQKRMVSIKVWYKLTTVREQVKMLDT